MTESHEAAGAILRANGDISRPEARRMALAAQGFATARPEGPVERFHLRGVMERLGLVQLDSVNVLARSHYLPFFSRLGSYDLALLDEFTNDREEVFEYWAHVASLVPAPHFPLVRHRMDAWKPGRWMKEMIGDHPGYIEAVLDEVREKGPLTAADLDDPGERRGSWWGYGRGKAALEYHFARGAVSVSERRGFARIYDLAERVIPPSFFGQTPLSREEAHREMLINAARALGIGTARDLADYYRISMPEARPRILELINDARLRKTSVEGWSELGYMDSEASVPPRINAQALLSPFDSLVWERARTERIFDFHYRIEIYVPERKRKHGYYVLPFLLGDEIVARVDLKAERDRGTLRAKAAFIEPGRDESHVAHHLADELRQMADWLGLDRVRVGRRGDLIPALRAALAR